MENSLAPLEIAGILITSKSGRKIIGKYYKETPELTQQKPDLEKKLHTKVSRSDDTGDEDILLFEKYSVIYRSYRDVRLYLLTAHTENELVALEVFNAFLEALGFLLDHDITELTIAENLDLVLLLIDELVDDGMVYEINSEELLQRVSMRDSGAHGGATSGISSPGYPNDVTLASAMKSVGDQLFRSLRG